MCEPIFSSTATDGAKIVDGIYFFDLEINRIEKIEKSEHSFLIFDFDTNETLLESEPIVMTFK